MKPIKKTLFIYLNKVFFDDEIRLHLYFISIFTPIQCIV